LNTSTTIPTLSPLLAADAPLLLWSSGRVSMRPQGSGRFSNGIGFYSEVGKDAEFDEACKAAKLRCIEIRHSSGGTSLNWSFGETMRVYPLTTGPKINTVFELKNADKALANAQAGVGARWTTDFNGKPASQAAVRCLLPDLLDVGFTGLLQLQLKSTMSDHLLKALAEHLRIGHAAVAQLGKAVTLTELELPLGPGIDVTVGRTKDQQATLTPLAATHPKAVTREYLESIYRPDNRALFEELWASVVAWAEEYTAASREQAPAAGTPRDDIYLPQPDEMELAISQARTQDVLERYRSHTFDLRDQGKITVEEQAHLSALIEDRLDDLVGGI
jgi:hypothetical protein